MTSSGVKQLLRIGGSLLLLILTLYAIKIDWRKGLELAGRADMAMIALAVLLLLAERAVSVFKWLLLLRAKGSRITFWRLTAINFIGGFWGLILPSSVSTDIVRGYYLSRNTANVSLAVTSMLVDRLIGALALVLLGCLSAWIVGDVFGMAHTRFIALCMAAACMAGIALSLSKCFTGWVDENIVRRLPGGRIAAAARQGLAACLQFRRFPRTLAASFALTVLVQMFRVLLFYVVAIAFGVRVSVAYYFVFVPLIMLFIMLPVSVGGIGVREGSFVAFFNMVGVPMDEAFVVSFAVSVLTTLITAAGGLVYVFDKGALKPMAAAPPPGV